MATSGSTPRVEAQTETGRLEAFSDGVFAVAITLLVLDLTVPHLTGDRAVPHLKDALLAQWPIYLAYTLSFLNILIMWVNHHMLFQLVRRTDHLFLLLNGFLLLVVTTIPFGTSLLAAYLQEPDKKVAQVIYSGLSLILALIFNRMWAYASRNGRLLDPEADKQMVRSITRQYGVGPLLYTLAFGMAFISAELSLAICILLSISFALPSTVTRRFAGHAGNRAMP